MDSSSYIPKVESKQNNHASANLNLKEVTKVKSNLKKNRLSLKTVRLKSKSSNSNSSFKAILKSFVLKLANFFNFIDLTCTNPSSKTVKEKLAHTILGSFLLLLIQIMPPIGSHIIGKYVGRSDYLQSDKRFGLEKLGRNVVMVAPLCIAAFNKYFNVRYRSEKQQRTFNNGIKMALLFAGGCFREFFYFRDALINTKEQASDTIFIRLLGFSFFNLFPIECVAYLISILIFGLMTIYIENYLTAYGLFKSNSYIMALQSFIEISHVIITSHFPFVNSFKLLTVCAIVSTVLVLGYGYYYLEKTQSITFNLEHEQKSSIKQKMVFSPIQQVSGITITVSIIRSTTFTAISRIWNPFFERLGAKVSFFNFFLVPPFFTEHPILAHQRYRLLWQTLPFSNCTNSKIPLFYYFYYWGGFLVELLVLHFIYKKIDYFINDLTTENIQKMVNENHYRLELEQGQTFNQYSRIDKKVKKLKKKMYRYAVTNLFFKLFIVYPDYLSFERFCFFYSHVLKAFEQVKRSKTEKDFPFLFG